VAERAAAFADPFGAGEEARLAGLLHDLGKYSDSFTLRLEGKAHGLDHWSAGAWVVLTRYQQAGMAAALAIQGHHVGLGSRDGLRDLRPELLAARHPLGLTLTAPDPKKLLDHLERDGLRLPTLTGSVFDQQAPKAAAQLDVRMLFSALVDADFLETEAHFQGEADGPGAKRHRAPGPELAPERALAALDAHLDRVAAGSRAAARVNDLRADLRHACLDAAALPPGLFTLTAPTGSGKTLSLLGFALRHAVLHGLRRIVVALPFLSLLEQTVAVYREVFGESFGADYVVEHHSLAGTRDEAPRPGADLDAAAEAKRRARQLAENWDAPVVVTTSVQLLESLFADRPRACRKLHRLAGSVLLLDEVQTLPPRLAAPTLAALSHLAHRYGATVVFATATQPAFEGLADKVKPLAATGWQPREIAPESLQLFARARRNRVHWRLDEPLSWTGLAAELAGRGQALAIVNLKRHARELAGHLQALGAPGLALLSTNLCPAHRERVLAEVRAKLLDDTEPPCLLVSTQCIEAGVDVDFPAVYRALAPLDAIAQAAGRANRNGRLDAGEVHVFEPPPEDALPYPDRAYGAAAEITREMLRDKAGDLDLDDPKVFHAYFTRLYLLGKQAEIDPKLLEAIQTIDFTKAAQSYRLIDQDTVQVLVPYDLPVFRGLRAELARTGLTRVWVQRARPHTVNLYRPKRDDPRRHFLEPVLLPAGDEAADWYVLLDEDGYDRDLHGLLPAEDAWIA
jgi:CRISPR-associated endonuclease/helicase Cas3